MKTNNRLSCNIIFTLNLQQYYFLELPFLLLQVVHGCPHSRTRLPMLEQGMLRTLTRKATRALVARQRARSCEAAHARVSQAAHTRGQGSALSRDEFYCATTRAALRRLLAHKLLSKFRTLLKLAKQERLQKVLERSRVMWPKYVFYYTQRINYKRASELVCVLECLCVWCG